MKKNDLKTEKTNPNYGLKQKALLYGLLAFGFNLFLLLCSLNASAQSSYGNYAGNGADGIVINDDRTNNNTFLRFQNNSDKAWRINHENGTLSFSYSTSSDFANKGTEYVTLGNDGKFTIKNNTSPQGVYQIAPHGAGGVDLYSPNGDIKNYYQTNFVIAKGAPGSSSAQNYFTIDNNGAITATQSITANSFKKSGGTSSQFLKADGSVDYKSYLPTFGGTITGQTVIDAQLIVSSTATANSFVKSGGTSTQFLKADGSVDDYSYLKTSGGTITGGLNVNSNALSYVTNKGAWLHWNRSQSDGETWLINQKGLTSTANAGIRFASSTSNNIVTEWARFIDNGNFGIGTTSPSEKLEVSGNIKASQNITANSFVKSGGTATQFLKADGSVDGSSYLPLTGGTVTGNIINTGSFTSSTSNTINSTITNKGIFKIMPHDGPGVDLYSQNGDIKNFYQSEYVIAKGIPGGTNSVYFKINNSGNVGIGTTSPSEKLEVSGNIKASQNITANSFVKSGGTDTQFLKADGSVDNNTYLTSSGGVISGNTKTSTLIVGTPTGLSDNTVATFGGVVQITPAGQTPLAFDYDAYGADYLLWVESGIVTTDVAYSDLTDWADYVFDQKYELMPIKEVDQFIQKNGHLPNIPSEAEVKKDGFKAVDMTKKLLLKIEELTLYSIAQDKKIEALTKAVEQLQKK